MLDRIGDKWTALVVLVLLDGPQRFGQLRGRVGGVAPKVLTETLRRLERDGILTTKMPEKYERQRPDRKDLGALERALLHQDPPDAHSARVRTAENG